MNARIITAPNVNYALREGLWWLITSGIKSDSRNGPVIRAPGPVITQYIRPWERLAFSPTRDANHVFHLMETIWMLAGQNNVEWLLQFNKSFSNYAEDNGVQHGAYGHRWRGHFMFDQLEHVVKELEKPNNRRVVLQMWDTCADMGSSAKDVPCNTHIYFQVLDGKLEMTVCCRSNDMIWGAYGANAVHFSMLQELIALQLRVEMGTYYQFSNNFHIYTEFGPGAALLEERSSHVHDPYGYVKTIPLLAAGETIWDFIRDCEGLVAWDDEAPLKTRFMNEIAMPLRLAYLDRKQGKPYGLHPMPVCDWNLAFSQWVGRRDNV